MWGFLCVMVVCVTSLYILFCVDSNSTGCAGKLRRFVFHRLPEVLEYFSIFKSNKVIMVKEFLGAEL